MSSVREIIEQPLYMGSNAWGRTSEGSTYRFDPSLSDFSGRLHPDERGPDGKARRRVNRDLETWSKAPAAVQFEPIVPSGIWLENLGAPARGRGARRPLRPTQASDPNRYPLPVVHRVRPRMQGQPTAAGGDTSARPTTTPTAASARATRIDRDTVVWFAVETLRRLFARGCAER